MNKFHDEMDLTDGIHISYSFEYADSTARESATGFSATDIGKFARQLSDNTIWMLIATTPTWTSITGSGGGGSNLVLISSNDTTPGYLEDKIVGTTNKISVSTLNDGGNEDLQFNIGSDIFDKSTNTLDNITDGTTYGKVNVSSLTTNEVDHTKILNIGTNSHGTIDSHLSSTSNPHSVTTVQLGLDNVTNDAQLKRAANDFTTFTEKISPASADVVLIEDSADSFNKKKIQIANFVDDKVKVSVNDTTSSYLSNKIVGTTNKISVSISNGGSNESFVFNIGSDIFDKSTNTLDDITDGITYGKVNVSSLTTGEVDHTKILNIGTNSHGTIDSHLSSTSNPHSVTATQVGLANVTNDAQLKRASNDFTTFTTKSTPSASDVILIEDSADSFNKKTISVSSLSFASNVFGSEFDQNSSEAESSTTSATLVNKLTLTTSSLPIGTYRIEFYSEIANSKANTLHNAQVTLDATPFALYAKNCSSVDDYIPFSGSYFISFGTAATHTLTIDYSTTGNTIYIRRARLAIWRIS